MSASQDEQANSSLRAALSARARLNAAKEDYTHAYMRYLRDGREAGWSWRRIGRGLGVSNTAVRRFFAENRQRIGRLT